MKAFALFLVVPGVLFSSAADGVPADPDRAKADRAVIENIVYDCTGWALTKDLARLKEILEKDHGRL